MKKGILLSAFCAVVFLAGIVGAFNPTTWTDGKFTGSLEVLSGYLDSNGTTRLTLGSDNHFVGNTSMSGGQNSMGTVGTALSSLNTSGLSSGDLYYAYLAGTVNAVEGSVLVATTSVSNQISVIVAPATVGLTSVAGVASSAVSTGSVVGVYSSGGWAEALTTGTVVAGDQLATSSLSAGYLYAPQSGTNSLLASTQTVAVALTAGTAAGGRTRVRIR